MTLKPWIGNGTRVIVLLAVAVATATAAIGFSRVVFPYDIGHYEANAWAPAALLAHGHDPYDLSRSTSPPYVASPYGPLHYALTGLGLRLFGTNFWFVRLASVLAVLATALCIGTIASALSDRSRQTPAIAALAFLASFPVVLWVGLQRADVFALALSMAALLLAVRDADRAGLATAAGAGGAAACALLFRQSAVLPLLMVLTLYAYRRDRGGALIALGSAAAVLAVPFVAFGISSGNDAIHQLYVSQRSVPFDGALLLGRIEDLLDEPGTLVVTGWVLFGLFHLARGTIRATESRVPLALLVAYLIAATGLAALTSGRAGANLNYWLEPMAVAALLVGLLIGQLPSGRPHLPVLVAGSLALAAAVSLARAAHGELLRWEAKPYLDDVTAAIRTSTPREAPSFSVYPELVSKADRRYFINDYVQYDGRDPELARAYERLLGSKRLAAVVTHARRPPSGYRRADPTGLVPAGIFPVHLHVRQKP
jgi:4-amino-4-deoxy-L-arabinose transferase-like glycosyltransferase